MSVKVVYYRGNRPAGRENRTSIGINLMSNVVKSQIQRFPL